ncbi:MAG: hypothetical protein PHH77_12895 [Victivallaceae bacterium]|nr:hypothetical protein [Victivallaceae bacterium]
MCLLPMLLAAFGFSLLRAWNPCGINIVQAAGIGMSLIIVSGIISLIWVWIHSSVKLWRTEWSKNLANIILIILAGAAGGVILWKVFTHYLPSPEKIQKSRISSAYNCSAAGKSVQATVNAGKTPTTSAGGAVEHKRDSRKAKGQEKYYPEIYTCFAVPVVLLIFLLIMTLYLPFTLNSKQLQEENLEWLGRFAGTVLRMAVVWAGISSLILFSPWLFVQTKAWIATVSIGGLASGIALVLGWSAKSPASPQSGMTWRDLAAKTAAPLAVIVLCLLLSFFNDYLFYHISWNSISKDLLNVRNRGADEILYILLILLLISAMFGIIIDSNRFSLHGLYRNRLIRAYLSPSRPQRTPNWFTGFDYNDNPRFYQLRHGMLKVNDISDPAGMLRAISNIDKDSGEIKRFVYYHLEKDDKGIFNMNSPDLLPGQITLLRECLVSALNRIICKVEFSRGNGDSNKSAIRSYLKKTSCFFEKTLFNEDSSRFAYWPEPPEKRSAVLPENDISVKRTMLSAAYPDFIKPLQPQPKMLHVINTALNLVENNNAAWTERKADSFTFSPLHCGNRRLGYCKTENYFTGSAPSPVSLGTALAVSGAAVSPNMGYHSSIPVAFLLTLFNVRLGCWLRNPGKRRNILPLSFQSLVNEAIGNTNDDSSWVYLSDGGHFENLGLYEMVMRRCHIIVVSDAGCDPDYKLEDLGNAVRKIRIDLGISIEMHDFKVESPQHAHCCALGIIKYGEVDAEALDGYLIYIKAGMCSQEALDVISYSKSHAKFPHETTQDQFFSESQFESYRTLGKHIMEELCRSGDADVNRDMDFEELLRNLESRQELKKSV